MAIRSRPAPPAARRLAALLLLPALASLPPAQEPDLIPNPGFENPGEAPAGWTPRTWGGAAELALVEEGRGGGRALRIRAEKGADAGFQASVTVRPWRRYRLCGWLRTEDVEAGAGRGALLNLHNLQPVQTPPVTGTRGWTRVAVDFLSADLERLEVNCLLGGWGQSRGTAWFDDLALEDLGEDPPDRQATLDAGRSGPRLSPYLYGQFIEHLGRCIQGGIWAEMLEDRKFLLPVGAAGSPWRPWPDGSRVEPDPARPFAGVPVPAVALDGGRAGIAQGGLELRAGIDYVGHAWLAGEGAPVHPVAVLARRTKDGRETRQEIPLAAAGPDYVRADFRFLAGEGRAELRIAAAGQGRLRIGAVSLMPADHVRGLRADVLRRLRELGSPLYRWPGGNFVSGYEWRDGIGPRDRRPPRPNPAWLGLEPNDFGLDEFLAFCREVAAEPLVVVNSGFGDAASAAAEVEYANGGAATLMGALRAAHGRPEPWGVAWWGIGNEMYGGWQLGYMAPGHYVRKHNDFAARMRAADPGVRLVGVGAAGPWSERMLRECGGAMELLSEHFYCGEIRESVVQHVNQIPNSVKKIADFHRRLRAAAPDLAARDVGIALDEWNYWYGPHEYGELGVRYRLKDGLGIAAGLHELCRQGDLFRMACYAQTVNVIGAVKATPASAWLETTGHVLALYRKEFGVHQAALEGATAPLDAAAAWTADRTALTVALVNPTPRPMTLDLELRGAALAGGGRRFVMAGPDPEAANGPGREEALGFAAGEAAVDPAAPRLEAPAYGVVLYVLPARP